jgi:hypothetical protein
VAHSERGRQATAGGNAGGINPAALALGLAVGGQSAIPDASSQVIEAGPAMELMEEYKPPAALPPAITFSRKPFP